jgi:hypothetical protein
MRGFQGTQITIGDVVGLSQELSLRPLMGIGYTSGGVAYVDESYAL